MPYTYKEEKYELIPNGKYECQIEKAEFKETPTNHKKHISLTIRIRSDIEQNENVKGRIIFDDIWAKKDDETTYDEHKINRILGTQDIAEGTTFDTIQDVVKAMIGAYLVCDIRTKHDDYKNDDVNFIHHYESSNAKPQKLGEQAPASGNLSAIEIDDKDLPF